MDMFPNIEAELRRHKWSREYLAEFLQVSPSTVTNWLRGHTDIPAKALVKMATQWNVSIDYLLGFTPSPDGRREEPKSA